jgi:hypothetical protein
MCLKIRCDEESEKFYKIFWELNKPCKQDRGLWRDLGVPAAHLYHEW